MECSDAHAAFADDVLVSPPGGDSRLSIETAPCTPGGNAGARGPLPASSHAPARTLELGQAACSTITAHCGAAPGAGEGSSACGHHEAAAGESAAGDSHAGARHPRGSCTARIFCPLLSCDEHNCTSRNSWPQTLLSRRTRRTHRTRHPEHARVRTAAGRGIERSAASLDAHCHARRLPSSARSAGPVWRAQAGSTCWGAKSHAACQYTHTPTGHLGWRGCSCTCSGWRACVRTAHLQLRAGAVVQHHAPDGVRGRSCRFVRARRPGPEHRPAGCATPTSKFKRSLAPR